MAVRMRHHLGSVVGDLRFEPMPTRVRALVDGDPLIDWDTPLLAWEPRRIVPVYAVPKEAFPHGVEHPDRQPPPADLGQLPPMLGPSDFATHTCPGTVLDVATATGGLLRGAGFRPDDLDLGGAILLDFAAFDVWLVEDEPRVGHPHDPFKRISTHASSRQVEVSLDGTVLAASDRTQMLLETHLPPRWYFPPEDVRRDLLVPSETTSTCAYKGHASYFSVPGRAEDVAWCYPDPLDDAERVRDYICFWDERTDLRLDGVRRPRPVTPWSTPEEQAEADPDRLEFG